MRQLTLVTGATGFLGGAVIARLIEKSGAAPLLLVRCDSAEQGLERVRANLRLFGISEATLAALKPEQILRGDFTDVSVFQCDARLDDVTHVVNCAAVTSFADNPLVWTVNVTGTLSFARRMATLPRLKRFLHVGTAMACGPQAGPVVFEDYKPPGDVHHLVPYTKSKSEIERVLREQLPLLPLIVVRPSIVVGHTRYGCTPSGSIFWVFRLAQMLEKFTYEFDDPIDVVPVDYAARAIVHLLYKPVLQHDLYHIAAGETRASTFREIDVAIADGFSRHPLGDRYRRAPIEELRRRAFLLDEVFSAADRRLLLKAIRLYGAFAELKIMFNIQRLINEGIAPPPRFSDYAGLCAHTCRHLSLAQQMQADFK